MTCLDARERFSDLVDERLDADGRAAIDAHLVGCDACRTELERFRATVALVRSLGPARAPAGFAARAPAGFAARVLAAAGDTPRARPAPRRWLDRLVFPLPVKLPLEAAAVLLVGVGVAYVFTHSPELQQATRVDAPAVVQEPRAVQSAEPTPATPAPAAPRGEGMTPAVDATRERADAPQAKGEAPAPESDKREAAALAPVTTPAPRAPAAPAPPAVAQSQMERRQQAPGIGSMAPDAQQRQAPVRVLRDSARAKESDAKVQEAKDLASRSVAKAVAPPDLAGALVVPSRAGADTSLRELVARHRGQVLATSVAGSTTTIEVRIPRDAFAAFVAGLDALGRWRPDRQTPELPADVRLAIRLTE